MVFDRVCCLSFKNSYVGSAAVLCSTPVLQLQKEIPKKKTKNFNVEGNRQHISPSMGEGDESYKGSQ